MGALTPSQISDAFIAACLTEVRALKPGNVHIYAGGHGMQVADFETSAHVAAPHVSNPTLKVGERIRRAVEATFAAVHCNTNLGILLLCAPLAAAAELPGSTALTLRANLRLSLSRLDAEDAAAVFQAIAAASPGGLGEAATSDVRQPPDVSLLEAMHMASTRDLIAEEYVTDFEHVFAWHDREFAPRINAGWSAEDAIARVFLYALARVPDTHIARKFGVEAAEDVRHKASVFEAQHFTSPDVRPSAPEVEPALLDFDAGLKAQGRNPGSLADLMAAILFVSIIGREFANSSLRGATH